MHTSKSCSETKECPKCARKITLINFSKHLKACNSKNKQCISANPLWKINDSEYECPFCKKIFKKRGIGFHIWRKHTEDGRNFELEYISSGAINGISGWNKGLTKETSASILKASRTLKHRYKTGELVHNQTGRPHSEETKRKISISRKHFLEKHPEMVPYRLNHYSKGESYPERYFALIFKKANILVARYLQFGVYELDFANQNKNIDFEVNGEQHYADKRIVQSDLRRKIFLKSKGWRMISLRWSKYQKMNLYKREKVIRAILRIMR